MKILKLLLGVIIFVQMGCVTKPKKEPIKFKVPEKKQLKKVTPKPYKAPYLNDQNAIPFFYEYAQKNKENKVRITTKFGDIDVLLYDNTPYHRANFIFLTKKNISKARCFTAWFQSLSYKVEIQTVLKV